MDPGTLFAALQREKVERHAALERVSSQWEAAVQRLEERVRALEGRLAAGGGGAASAGDGESASRGKATSLLLLPSGEEGRSRGSPVTDSDEEFDKGDSDESEIEHDEFSSHLFGPDPRLGNDGKYTPAAGKEVSPTDLELTSVYGLKGSVWDCCLYAFLDCLGTGRSLVLLFITFAAAATQLYFCACVITNMIADPVSGETLDALLYFRTSIMHDVRYADLAQGRSLAAQVCAGDDGYQMQWAGRQVTIMDNINKARQSGSKLVMLALFVWFLTIIGELESIIHFLKALAQVTKVKGGTHLVEAELGAIVLKSLSKTRFWAMVVFVALPRLAIATLLGYTGAKFLLATLDPSDILLNAIALAFVLDIDELIYLIMAPQRAKCVLEHTEALPLPETKRTRLFNSTVVKFSAVTLLLIVSYYRGVQGIHMRMKQASDILCSGELNFVTAYNPATGIIQATKSMKGHGTELNSHGLAVLELAKPDINELMTGWKVPASYIEASRSQSRMARVSIGMEDLHSHLKLYEKTGRVSYYEMSLLHADTRALLQLFGLASATISEAAQHETCRDSPSVRWASDRLKEITGGVTSECMNVQPFCDGLNMTSARALCPITCGCANEVDPAAGFFASQAFGCPAACEKSLRAAMKAQKTLNGGTLKCEDVPASTFTSSRWLHKYFRGAFGALLSNVNTVMGFRGLLNKEGHFLGIPQNKSEEVFWAIVNYTFVDDTMRGRWEFAPGVPHPRGLTGCAFWTSWEVTVMLGADLCLVGHFRSLRSHCPVACGCTGGMQECPLSCAEKKGTASPTQPSPWDRPWAVAPGWGRR